MPVSPDQKPPPAHVQDSGAKYFVLPGGEKVIYTETVKPDGSIERNVIRVEMPRKGVEA